MNTEVVLKQGKNTKRPDIQAGQFWQHEDGEIYQVVEINDRYTLICVFPTEHNPQYKGQPYSMELYEDLDDVLGEDDDAFTFVSKLEVSVVL